MPSYRPKLRIDTTVSRDRYNGSVFDFLYFIVEVCRHHKAGALTTLWSIKSSEPGFSEISLIRTVNYCGRITFASRSHPYPSPDYKGVTATIATHSVRKAPAILDANSPDNRAAYELRSTLQTVVLIV